jgi:hypothetical protein
MCPGFVCAEILAIHHNLFWVFRLSAIYKSYFSSVVIPFFSLSFSLTHHRHRRQTQLQISTTTP